MKLRFAARFVPLLGLLIAATSPSAVLAQTTIRAEHDEPVESITHRLMVQAAAEIASATQGKVAMSTRNDDPEHAGRERGSCDHFHWTLFHH